MQKTKGISLIVLVITIIVMIVLAGAIVLTLNNSGIIDKATIAVDETNLATVKELTQMAWAEAYANGARTQSELQTAVDKALSDSKVNTEAYGILVTTKGVEVVRGWIQDGLTVKRGSKELEIGSDFNYDAEVEGYTAGWKILGAEDGELLIMSTADIAKHKLGNEGNATRGEEYVVQGQNDWLNGPAELDALCVPYGKGENATGARSIRVEDVNKITGYAPETAKFEKGEVGEYGNEVSFIYNGTKFPSYKTTNGISRTTTYEQEDGFRFYNGTEFVHVNNLEAGIKGTTFATLKSDGYEYKAADLMDTTSDAYTMLFGGDVGWYWIASTCVYMNDIGRAVYCMFTGDVDWVYFADLWCSDGIADAYRKLGVRAVVSLASDIQI